MNCRNMMQIPELTEVLKLKAGENGLEVCTMGLFCRLPAVHQK